MERRAKDPQRERAVRVSLRVVVERMEGAGGWLWIMNCWAAGVETAVPAAVVRRVRMDSGGG